MLDFFRKNKPQGISIFFVFMVSFILVAIFPLLFNHLIEKETIWKYDEEVSRGINRVFEDAKESQVRESFRTACLSIERNFDGALRALQTLTAVYPYWEEMALRQVHSSTQAGGTPKAVPYSTKLATLIFRIRAFSNYAAGFVVFDSHFNRLFLESNPKSRFTPSSKWLKETIDFKKLPLDSTCWRSGSLNANHSMGLFFGFLKFRAAENEYLGVLFLDVKGVVLNALLQNKLNPSNFFIYSPQGEILARFFRRNNRVVWMQKPLIRPPKIDSEIVRMSQSSSVLVRKKLRPNAVAFLKKLPVPGWRLVYLFDPTTQEAPMEALWNHYKGVRKHYFGIYIYFLFMIILLTIGISWLLLQFFKNKKTQFIRHLSEIGNGNFSVKLEGGKLKEFEQISDSINRMSSRLQETLEEIKQSEQRYRLLLENAGDAILICKETGEIVEANPRCEKVLGLSPAELRQQNVKKLFVSVPLTEYLTSVGENKSLSALEVPFHRKDGHQIFLRISSSKIEFRGSRYFQLILHNLTQQKLFEEQLVTQNRVLNLLHSITRSVVSKPDLNQAYRESLNHLMELSEASLGAIYLVHSKTRQLRFVWGSVPDADRLVRNLEQKQGVLGLALRNRDIVSVPIVEGESAAEETFSKKITEKYHINRYLEIPLLSENGAVGLILLGLAGTSDLSPQLQSLLLSVGSQIGLLIQHSILVEQQKKRAYQLELLSQGVKIWMESQNFQAVLQKSVDHLHEKLGYWHVAIFSYLPAEKKLSLSALAGGLENVMPAGYKQSEQKGILGQAIRRKTTYYAPETEKDPHYHRFQNHQSKSELAVPIKTENTILGVVNIEGLKPFEFDEIDIATLETFADQLAVYYQFAARVEKEKQYAYHMELVAKLGSILNSSLDSKEFIQSVVDSLRSQMGYFYVSVYLRAEDHKDTLVKTAHSGGSRSRRPLGFRVHGGEGLLGRAFETGLLVYSNDVSKDRQFIPVGEKPTGSEVCAPLRFNEDVLGVLNVESLDKNSFSDIDLHIIQTIANQMSQAVYKANLFSRLKYEKNKLDQILSEIDQGIAMADVNGRVLFANPTFRRYFPETIDQGENSHEFPFCEVVRRTPEFREFKEGKLNSVRVQFQEGEHIFLISVSQFVDFDFSRFILYVVNDISQLKNLEHEKIRGERLKLAMEMAGSIAHEINQPLTGIMGYLSLLREETDPGSPLQEDLREIEKQADRINDLIKKFSNVVKIRTKEYVGETQIIDWEQSTKD